MLRRPAVLALSVLPLLLTLSPATAWSDTGSDQSDDPVVAGLLELIAADLSEAVILRWIDTQEITPAPPSAAMVIELRSAGASDAILERFLERATPRDRLAARRAPQADPLSKSATASVIASNDFEGGLENDTVVDSAVDSAVDSGADSSGDSVADSGADATPTPPSDSNIPTLVDFTLSYVPEFKPEEKEWGLYVYLDGKPLSYVAQGSMVLGADALRFQQPLAPGRHQVRIVQENHLELRSGETFHEARVAPTDIVFQVEPGGTTEIEISVRRPFMGFGSEGPITYRVAQNGRILVVGDDTGGDPDRWRFLCEDKERSGERPTSCDPWADFWTVDAPPRHEVLRALSLFEYRPVPKNQDIH